MAPKVANIYYFNRMLELLPYKSEQDSRLDHFVFCESINGTFLQSRQFLNYHPAQRFKEAGFALERSGTLAAYFPGVEVLDSQGNPAFISHQGSTFGGPVFSKAFYSGSRVLEVLKFSDNYFSQRYKRVKLKITPALFAKESPDIIEYALEHLGYTRHTELSAYSPLTDDAGKPLADPLANCEKECRRIFRNSEKFDIEYRPFNGTDDLKIFYDYLKISKAKHGTKPVHSVEELLDLQSRLEDCIRFRGIWLEGNYIAGMMLFAFKELGLIHAQYIAPDNEFKEFQPTTCLYVHALREAAKEGFKKFSWGISTEDGGNYLNENLLRFKEGFGAKTAVNVTYTKEF